ncbi:MAG: response regulator transcription factor [Anaerovibrio sp.]|uniref:response regulator n=1 Tax=uncultured Anaerovibrio sp. TaxID=361586 RepID=UPI001B7A7B6B|nr:response regulator transcription factor [uncultured Anaerovibrio sp.]MBP3231949.1 response regulator transcription factor [Anaerovibrio sp.]
MAIRVLIADDHAILRQGIKRVLNFESDIEVVGETGEGQETLAKTLMLQPDILLLDLNMPGLTGMEVARQLQSTKCSTKIIALTIHDNDTYVIEMLKNGASGYLLKDVDPEVLVKAIHVVNDGGAYIYPELEERIFGKLRADEDITEKAKEIWEAEKAERLTDREMEVLACIAKGFNNQEIAKTLFVSEKTVKNHLTNIFRKLGVSDRTQALIYVLKHNIMRLD